MNSCFLKRALLSIAVAITGSVVASGLFWLGFPVVAVAVQATALACLALAMVWIAANARLIRDAREVCARIAAGDFEARILAIPEHAGTPELLRAINDVIDGCDAFVREATAAMDAVHQNKYFRRILPGGLHGALLQGATTFNRASASIESRIRQFEHQTAELEGRVGRL